MAGVSGFRILWSIELTPESGEHAQVSSSSLLIQSIRLAHEKTSDGIYLLSWTTWLLYNLDNLH